jgi:hypothetical protein
MEPNENYWPRFGPPPELFYAGRKVLKLPSRHLLAAAPATVSTLQRLLAEQTSMEGFSSTDPAIS